MNISVQKTEGHPFLDGEEDLPEAPESQDAMPDGDILDFVVTRKDLSQTLAAPDGRLVTIHPNPKRRDGGGWYEPIISRVDDAHVFEMEVSRIRGIKTWTIRVCLEKSEVNPIHRLLM